MEELKGTYKNEYNFFKKHGLDFTFQVKNGYYSVNVFKDGKRLYSFKGTVADLEIMITLLYRVLKEFV